MRRSCRHCLLGLVKASARLVERSPSGLFQLGRRMTLCLSRPRRNKTIVQKARGRLRGQVRGRGRAALQRARGLRSRSRSCFAGCRRRGASGCGGFHRRWTPCPKPRAPSRRLRSSASASRPRAATATTQRRRQSSRLGGGVGGFGFRFRETPTRFGEPRLEVARSLPGARDLLQTSLEAFGHPDAIETLDFAQSSLKAEGAQDRLEACELGFLRLELGSPRSELVARLHELLDAARPFLHPCWRTRMDAEVFPEFAPTLLGFCERALPRALRRPAPKRTGASVRRAAGFPVDARPDAQRLRSRRPSDDPPPR